MSDIDEYRTIHEILGEKQRCINENEIFRYDVERLTRVLSLQEQPSTTKDIFSDNFDTIATNIIEVSNSNFDNKEYLISLLKDICSYILSSKELNWFDFFSRLFGIASEIIRMSNMKIYNPLGSYFNQLLRENNFTSQRTKECIEQYSDYNSEEEARWLAINIYIQLWNVLTFSPSSIETESQIELSKLNNEHNQAMKEWCNSNRRSANQSEFDVRKYINCFKMEFARQDEEMAEIIVMGKTRLEAYKEEARRKTEQQMKLGMKKRLQEQKSRNTQQPSQIEIITKPKKKETTSYGTCGIIAFTLSILYLVSIGDMDYGYYQFLRIISFVLIPIFAYLYWKIEKIDDSLDIHLVYIPSGLIWILFNPIVPIYLSKDTWMVFDIVCAIAFLAIDIFLFFVYRYNKKED